MYGLVFTMPLVPKQLHDWVTMPYMKYLGLGIVCLGVKPMVNWYPKLDGPKKLGSMVSKSIISYL